MAAEFVPVQHGGEFGYAFDSQKKCIAKSRIYLRVTVSMTLGVWGDVHVIMSIL